MLRSSTLLICGGECGMYRYEDTFTCCDAHNPIPYSTRMCQLRCRLEVTVPVPQHGCTPHRVDWGASWRTVYTIPLRQRSPVQHSDGINVNIICRHS